MIAENIFRKTKLHDSLRDVGTTGTYIHIGATRVTSVSKGRGSSSATVGEGGRGWGGGGGGRGGGLRTTCCSITKEVGVDKETEGLWQPG